MYKIMGKYKGGETEVIDETDSGFNAVYLLSEYQMAFGAGYSLWIVEDKNADN